MHWITANPDILAVPRTHIRSSSQWDWVVFPFTPDEAFILAYAGSQIAGCFVPIAGLKTNAHRHPAPGVVVVLQTRDHAAVGAANLTRWFKAQARSHVSTHVIPELTAAQVLEALKVEVAVFEARSATRH